MFTLIIGGAASGKSEFAESLTDLWPAAPKYYIATMEPLDGECTARIQKHRLARKDRRFETLERYTDLKNLRLPKRGNVLLDCLGNLAANELYSPQGAGTVSGALAALTQGIEALLAQCDHLVVVSNEVGTGGSDYLGQTGDYLSLLALTHRRLAQRADQVCEVTAGLPQWYKGGL